jgi:hypothetical protein
MPRPESPEGPWVTIPVRVRKSLQDRIDGVRGEANRSEWFRSLAESAVGDAGREPPADACCCAEDGDPGSGWCSCGGVPGAR